MMITNFLEYVKVCSFNLFLFNQLKVYWHTVPVPVAARSKA